MRDGIFPALSRLSIALIVVLLLPALVFGQFPPFAIVGDTHVGYSGSAYKTIIGAIDEQKVGIIVHLGDAIDKPGNIAEWAEFQRITGSGKTLYLVPGNHDVDSRSSMATYLSLFQKSHYSVSDGDTVFIMLNTEIPGERGMITGEQYEWLEGELRKPFKYKFVFLHEPLFPVFAGHGLDKFPEARDKLHQLFAKNGVSLVVSGHDHLYNKSTKDGITYIIASGGGGRFYLTASAGAFLHYMVGSRTEKGYSFVVKDVEGQIKDRFMISR